MKKLNKFFAILVALAMMATLCVSMAFAAPDATGMDVTDVNIKKTLTKNDGTTTPGATFKFLITPNTSKGNSAAPAVSVDDITYSAADNTAASLIKTRDLDAAIEAAMVNTPNGQYAYDVIEDTENSTGTTTENGITHTYTHDTTHYVVRVYKSGTAAAPVYKYTVSVVDPTTGDETKKPIGSTDGDTTTTDLDFNNKYVKTTNVTPDGGDPSIPDNPNPGNDAAGLSVQKKVANDDAGLYDDKEFTFELRAKAPAVNTIAGEKTGYAYQVVEIGTGAPVAGKSGKLVPGDGTEAATEISLTDDQRLVFTDLDVGAIISVKEKDYSADFTQEATKNDTNAFAIAAGDTATIEETASKVIVTNTSKNKTTPEGILISNLPYIALALVAIGGLVAYVVVRRKADDEA